MPRIPPLKLGRKMLMFRFSVKYFSYNLINYLKPYICNSVYFDHHHVSINIHIVSKFFTIIMNLGLFNLVSYLFANPPSDIMHDKYPIFYINPPLKNS